MKHISYLVLLSLLVLLTACGGHDYSPKPEAYLRFDFPEKVYHAYDTAALPFSFECAEEAQVIMKRDNTRDKWVDITYPNYSGVLYLSYKNLRNTDDLRGQIDTSYELLKAHFDHSSGVNEEKYIDPSQHVYATTYQLKGSNVASTYQFWATDSVNHFLRGALFLSCTPNNDSLAPVIDYLQQDIVHLLETLKWK